jgi:hypothetical protein
MTTPDTTWTAAGSAARLREALEEAFEVERATSQGNAWNRNSREFVISRATAALAVPAPAAGLDVGLLADMAVMSLGSVLTGNDYARYHELFRARFVERLRRAAEYARLEAE